MCVRAGGGSRGKRGGANAFAHSCFLPAQRAHGGKHRHWRPAVDRTQAFNCLFCSGLGEQGRQWSLQCIVRICHADNKVGDRCIAFERRPRQRRTRVFFAAKPRQEDASTVLNLLNVPRNAVDDTDVVRRLIRYRYGNRQFGGSSRCTRRATARKTAEVVTHVVATASCCVALRVVAVANAQSRLRCWGAQSRHPGRRLLAVAVFVGQRFAGR